ncbi:MAG: hypothetical protein M3O31_15975 [Acidobacteriota bacterium]|nr:hypothetical protein [Acidobacteriota bacterium]
MEKLVTLILRLRGGAVNYAQILYAMFVTQAASNGCRELDRRNDRAMPGLELARSRSGFPGHQKSFVTLLSELVEINDSQR